jgi:hypothetical protein
MLTRPNVNAAYACHKQLLTLPTRARQRHFHFYQQTHCPLNICDVLDYSAITAATLVVLHTNLFPVFIPLIASMLPRELFEIPYYPTEVSYAMSDYEIQLSIDPGGGDEALECQFRLVYAYFDWLLGEGEQHSRSLTMADFWDNLERVRNDIDGDMYIAFNYSYRNKLFEWKESKRLSPF